MKFKQFLQKFNRQTKQDVSFLQTTKPEALVRLNGRQWHVKGFKNFRTDFIDDLSIQEVGSNQEPNTKQRKEIRQKILNHLKQ